MALASDGKDVFFTIDNGGGSVTSNASTTPISGKTHIDVLSETVSRITLDEASGTGIQLVDWFRPADYQTDQGQDIGSGSFAILDEYFSTPAVKRIGVATSTNPKMYIQDVDNLGGYRQGRNGSDGVLQVIPLDGEVFGGIGSYPFEGGYIFVNPGNGPLSAFKFSPSNTSSQLFTLAGQAAANNIHYNFVGVPTVTSDEGRPGSGIVWVTDIEKGLMAYQAVPVNGSLVEMKLPKVEGANKYARPVFGDGRVYLQDGKGRLIALGAK